MMGTDKSNYRGRMIAVGLGWLAAPMRWRLMRPLFERLYGVFARHRLRLGAWFGKKPCGDDSCRLR